MVFDISLVKLTGNLWLLKFIEMDGTSPTLIIETLTTQQLTAWIEKINAAET